MKEIGGYFELEHFSGDEFHKGSIALNCGRNCLAYLIKARHIKKLAVPYYMCDSIYEICWKYNVELQYYHVNFDFMPEPFSIEPNTWVYVMNYYGQLTETQLLSLKEKYINIIVDNAQAYFTMPIKNIDTFYICRKFLGVPDGAFLYTDVSITENLPVDESHNRMSYLLGRFERTASEFYENFVENNDIFSNEPIKKMSKLTHNLLCAIDYQQVKRRRSENYNYLYQHLYKMNHLKLRPIEGAFAYPLLVEDAALLKKELIEKKIYIPTLWPNVLRQMTEKDTEYILAQNILPIPCDQRYDIDDMEYIINLIKMR